MSIFEPRTFSTDWEIMVIDRLLLSGGGDVVSEGLRARTALQGDSPSPDPRCPVSPRRLQQRRSAVSEPLRGAGQPSRFRQIATPGIVRRPEVIKFTSRPQRWGETPRPCRPVDQVDQ